jgi:hypothetical protein
MYKTKEKGYKGSFTAYLHNLKEGYPKRIYWKVIAPKDAVLSDLQKSDAIFDDYDLKIRKLPI